MGIHTARGDDEDGNNSVESDRHCSVSLHDAAEPGADSCDENPIPNLVPTEEDGMSRDKEDKEFDIDAVFESIQMDEGKVFSLPQKQTSSTDQMDDFDKWREQDKGMSRAPARPSKRKPTQPGPSQPTHAAKPPPEVAESSPKGKSKLEKEFGSKAAHIDALKRNFKGVKK